MAVWREDGLLCVVGKQTYGRVGRDVREENLKQRRQEMGWQGEPCVGTGGHAGSSIVATACTAQLNRHVCREFRVCGFCTDNHASSPRPGP